MAPRALAWMGLAAALAAGCGPADYGAICEAAVSCSGGNEKDIDACVRGAELQEERADIIGCSEEYDDLAACVETEGQCRDVNGDGVGDFYGTSIPPDPNTGLGGVDLCQAENENYGSCVSGSNGNFGPFFEGLD